MHQLDRLENRSVYLLREAYHQFKNLCLLWSIGKDSTVLLWLTRKAFFNHVPFPLVHIDTTYKIPEMIAYRDRLALEFGIDMIVGKNDEALKAKRTYPDGKVTHLQCCKLLKTEALIHTINGDWPRKRLNYTNGQYEIDSHPEPFTGVIVGLRADEEGSRSKERYFSTRDAKSRWDVAEQPPEFWNQHNTDFAPNTHIRVHPLLDWTELNVWEYIERESIPMVSLYFNQGDGKRYRSLGCWPCTKPIVSPSHTVGEIVEELRTGQLANIAERSGREQDKEDGGGLEELRKGGYM